MGEDGRERLQPKEALVPGKRLGIIRNMGTAKGGPSKSEREGRGQRGQMSSQDLKTTTEEKGNHRIHLAENCLRNLQRNGREDKKRFICSQFKKDSWSEERGECLGLGRGDTRLTKLLHHNRDEVTSRKNSPNIT